MRVFLIKVTDDTNRREHELCSEVLLDYFAKLGVEVFILDHNDYGVHPSWLKMKCFDYVDDDFVLCWDLDLLPRKKCPSILDVLDQTKINVAPDTIFTLQDPDLNDLMPMVPFFKYNCGLIGVPKSYRWLLDRTFTRYNSKAFPSFEQYYFNEELEVNKITDLNVLDKTWNCIFHPPTIPNHFILTSNTVHYTGKYLDSDIRPRMIEIHRRLYFAPTPSP